MRRQSLPCLAAMLLAALPSFAQTPPVGSQPAVSEVNGKVSLEGGAAGAQGRSSAIGITEGSLAAPLGHSFGVQIDGLAATAYNSFVGAGAAHLFWRDPQLGLIGPFAALARGGGTTIGWYGAEAEFYAPLFTVGGYGGYQDAGSSAVLASRGFYLGRLTVYPIPDLALAVGGGQFAGRALGIGSIEYQPDFVASHNLAFFVDGSAGDNSFYRVTGGVRLYLGTNKTLIRRHREDDPPSIAAGILDGNGGASSTDATGGAGGAGGGLFGNGGTGGLGIGNHGNSNTGAN